MKNDYYVYLHKTLDGKIFYIGKGVKKRAWSKSSRSTAWHEQAKNGYTVEIYKENLSNCTAIDIENQLISSTEGVVNRGTQCKVEFSGLDEYFKIDRNSYSGLSRIKGTWTGVYFSGKLGPCGQLRVENGVTLGWRVRHKGKTVQIHRLIWTLINGVIPSGMIVDHIDGNPENNLIENLRLIDVPLNTRNRKMSSRNSTGATGVRFHSNGYECRIVDNGIIKYKRFGVKKYGNEEAFRQACEWRSEQIRLLNEQGAGYTERHGT